MFRKLVANLSFSPSLVGELGFYARQLKREETLRLFGLVGAVVLLLLQLLISIYPPESANTAHGNDLIYGGFRDKAELLEKYDRNEHNFHDILSSFDITRKAIESAKVDIITSNDTLSIIGRISAFSHSPEERALTFIKESGGNGTVYLSPLALINRGYVPKQYPAFVGDTGNGKRFALLKASGNLIIKTPQSTTKEQCQSSSCSPKIEYSSVVTNTTKNKPATTTTVSPSDRITYSLTTKNISSETVTVPLVSQLRDILEYADVIDTDGGTLDVVAGTITWPSIVLQADQIVSKNVSVRVQPHVVATARGSSNPMSYDCVMSSSYGNVTTIGVACPLPKYAEAAASSLPQTSASLPLYGSLLLVGVTGFFYFRARQQREEIRLIRKDINTGTF